MTQRDINEMASECGLIVTPPIEAFAKLVAAKEREACAQLCIDEVWASTVNGTAVEAFNYASKECASRIRARGEA